MSDRQPKRALAAGRTAAAVAATVCALAFVSLATRAGSSTPARPPGWAAVADVGRHGLIGLTLAATPLLLAAGAVVWLTALVLARGRRLEEARRDPWALRRRRIVMAAWVIGIVTLFALDQRGYVHLRLPRLPGMSGGGGVAPAHVHAGSGSSVSSVDVGVAVVLWVAMAAVVAVVAQRWLRHRPAAAARAAMAAPLEEPAPGNDYASLRADPDARRAVIGAYAGLERTLSRRDLARTPAEGPREYLGRVVDSLRRSRSAAGRLTGLYERARFSPRAIDQGMRQAAVDALEQVDADVEDAP